MLSFWRRRSAARCAAATSERLSIISDLNRPSSRKQRSSLAGISERRSHQFGIGIFGDGSDLAVSKCEDPAIRVRVFAPVARNVLALALNRHHVSLGDHVQRVALAGRGQYSAQRSDKVSEDLV